MIKSSVHKILTFKSGNFRFSRSFNWNVISKLNLQMMFEYKSISGLPILPGEASRLEEELVRRSIFGTAAIEGNPLSEEEVGRILEGDTATRRAEREILNLGRAYQLLPAYYTGEVEHLSEAKIKQVHELLTQGVEHERNVPGSYRNHKVVVGDADHGGIYTPPKMLRDVQDLMREFITWINSPEMRQESEFVRAALAHYHLACIHPFADGNGRTARLVEALILASENIRYVPKMLSNYYYRNMDQYFIEFRKAQKSPDADMTGFLEFVFQGVLESLSEIRERIVGKIRVLALNAHFQTLREERTLTRRQYDLLRMLLDADRAFTRKDLFTAMPFQAIYGRASEQTARRDIKRLMELGALKSEDGQKYRLNMRLLG